MIKDYCNRCRHGKPDESGNLLKFQKYDNKNTYKKELYERDEL